MLSWSNPLAISLGLPASWSVELIDVLEDGSFGVTSRSPGPLPQQFSLDRLAECFSRHIIVTIPCPAHRYPEAMLAQEF